MNERVKLIRKQLGMTQEQLDAELRKGVESFNKGSFTADEIDHALAKKFGI